MARLAAIPREASIRARRSLAWRLVGRPMVGVLAVAALVAACAAEPLPDRLLDQDPRLSRKITLVAERAYLGDLIPELGKAGHVPLTLDDRNGASDPRLTVYVRDARLFDVLNAVWSAVSYRSAQWHWSTEGVGGSGRYRLSRGASAARLGASLREWLTGEFMRQADVHLTAATLDPESRKALLTQRASSLYPDDQRDGMLSMALAGQRKWDGLALFSGVFSPDERARILSGQTSGKMPLADLGEAATAFVRSVWERERVVVSVDGAPPVRRALPTHIEFSTEEQGSLRTPCLMIWMHREDGKSGYAYIGGMPLAQRLDGMITRQWSLDGDESVGPKEEFVVCTDAKTSEPNPPARSLMRCVRRLARAVPVSIVARLPPSVPADVPDPVGYRLGDYLALLKEQVAIMSKWRTGVLILSSQSWYRDEPDETPWRVVNRIREMQRADPDGILGLDGLAWLVRALTPAQLALLAEEYSGATAAIALREVLLANGTATGFARVLAAPGGLRLTAEQFDALRSSALLRSALPEIAPALRIQVRAFGNGDARVRRLEVSVRSGGKPWVPVARLDYGALAQPNVAARTP